VVAEAKGQPAAILLASGSEVALALEAQQELEAKKVPTRVVSLPSWEIFDRQPDDYRKTVLPNGGAVRLAIEAGVPMGWHRLVGADGDVLAIEGRFGASAPAKIVMEKLGFTADNVVARVEALLARAQGGRA
jgi:transketolase